MRNVLLSALASTLVACSSIGLFRGDGEDAVTAPQSDSPASSFSFRAQRLTVYLTAMQALAQSDPVVQAEAFQDVEQAANRAPTITNRLKLALVLGVPGHRSSDPLAAQLLLSELLTAGNALLPEERILAMIHLKDVEQRLLLEAEVQRVEQELNAEQTRQGAETTREFQVIQQENQRLIEELEDALEKLETITNIEQSIREREDGTDQP